MDNLYIRTFLKAVYHERYSDQIIDLACSLFEDRVQILVPNLVEAYQALDFLLWYVGQYYQK